MQKNKRPWLTVIKDVPGYTNGEVRRTVATLVNLQPNEVKDVAVKPLRHIMQKIVERLAKDKPDVIILPMRGAETYTAPLPKALRKRVIFMDTEKICDRFSWRVPEVERLKSAKKIAVLDDIIRDGTQVAWFQENVKVINPSAKVRAYSYSRPRDSVYFARRPNSTISKNAFCPTPSNSVSLSYLLRNFNRGAIEVTNLRADRNPEQYNLDAYPLDVLDSTKKLHVLLGEGCKKGYMPEQFTGRARTLAELEQRYKNRKMRMGR